MSEVPQREEVVSVGRVFEVEPIETGRGAFIKKREQIRELVEGPLLSACEQLYDKNIRTFDASANKKDIGMHAPGYITIDFNSLSDKNRKIAFEIGKIEKSETSDDPALVRIDIPLNESSTPEEIKSYADSIVKKFLKQRMTWAPTFTIEELREAYGGAANDETIRVDDFTGDYYYDPKGKLFYLSEEHFRKTNEKVDD